MINVEILSEDKILTLQNNVEELRDSMLSSQNNEWLKEFFNEEKPFIKSKLFIEDFELDMSTNNPVETDFENAKRLFKNLKITESQACDQRLWIGLTFSKFYDYMTYRYGKTLSQIKNKWLFQGPSYKASLFRQGLSMLWWYAYITYDKNNQENPYELTEYAFNHKDFIISIYSRTFCGSKHVTLGLIKALRDFEKAGGKVNTKPIYNGIVKYLSFLGGAYIIDVMTEKEIYDRCYAELIELYKKEFPEQKVFKL